MFAEMHQSMSSAFKAEYCSRVQLLLRLVIYSLLQATYYVYIYLDVNHSLSFTHIPSRPTARLLKCRKTQKAFEMEVLVRILTFDGIVSATACFS